MSRCSRAHTLDKEDNIAIVAERFHMKQQDKFNIYTFLIVGFNNKSIFLGEYNNQNELKVIRNDSILFVNNNLLGQTNQYSAKEFMKVLDSLDLYFIAEGDEPYWQLKLNSSELILLKYDLEKEEHFVNEIYFDKQSGFNIMFKSNNNRLFGLIRRVDFILDQTESCSLGLSDNYLVYEVFLTMDGEVYKGCGMIDRIK